MATSFSALQAEIEPCVSSLETTLGTAKTMVQPILDTLQQQAEADKGSPSGTASTGTASRGSARKAGAVGRGQPLQTLQKHLSKK
jgi:hypothetical protein